ncbi:hypothetical protein ACFHW0_31185 [Micromonospora sp. LOL_025]|uniref:hypothetical protein n=1 Tax=Micromonospora sp. LOL_025 TaxID=3345413 RepID=UPI003A85F722
MSDVDAAHRFLARLMGQLKQRGRAPAGTLAACALLASRLGHRPLAVSLVRLALRGETTADHRAAWLLHRLVGECLPESPDRAEILARTRREATVRLVEQYRRLTADGDVDPINGAGGVAMALWDVADGSTRHQFAPDVARTATTIVHRPRNDVYHGRSGGILLLRMLGARYGLDPALTTAVDTVVGEYATLDPATLDTGLLGVGGVTLCSGQPGMLTALGPDADPAVLARIVGAPITRASLHRLDGLLADENADIGFCHGLAGVGLGIRLAPSWQDLVGPDRADRLTARLAGHLDRTDDAAVATVLAMPVVHSVLTGPLGVALALAETRASTPPWWAVGVSLGDGTSAVVQRRAIGVTA